MKTTGPWWLSPGIGTAEDRAELARAFDRVRVYETRMEASLLGGSPSFTVRFELSASWPLWWWRRSADPARQTMRLVRRLRRLRRWQVVEGPEVTLTYDPQVAAVAGGQVTIRVVNGGAG